MTDIRALIDAVAAEEAAFERTRFVAPCVPGGKLRARVAGMVRTFTPRPRNFEGWGVFAPSGEKARLIEEADLMQTEAYLNLLPALRVRLVRQLQGQTWLAFPASEADMAQRFGSARPVAVHLVTEGAAFEQATARGTAAGGLWFEGVDRRADPLPAEAMREALRQGVEPPALAFAGVTPEMRATYDLVAQSDEGFQELRRRREEERLEREREQQRRAEAAYRRDQRRQRRPQHADADALARVYAHAFEDPARFEADAHAHRDVYRARAGGGPADAAPAQGQGAAAGGGNRDTARLREALRVGGGELRQATDRGEYWLVEWTSGSGARHTSAIGKGDLTVISSGICLSGRDRHFDLQSLVGVIERRGY